MHTRKRAWIGFWVVLLLLWLGVRAEAFYVDRKKTFSFNARAQTRFTLRLQDADQYTKPQVGVGDPVQWRNLALIEIDHDLKQLTKTLDILRPLKKLKIRTKYRLVGRFVYDAIYNVSSTYRDVRDKDPENIDKFKQSYDLWEFYFDFSRGPWFLRIGRQNLAWGDTDIFRLLDGINPLDNSFGGPFEDLDDRRIPLWMLRGSYNFGKVGPVSSFTLEGFWVPGSWDARVGPFPPRGTPYAPPLPDDVWEGLYHITPEKSLSNSRWGVRIQGILATSVNVSLAHYKTFPDSPMTKTVLLDPVVGPLTDFSAVQLQNHWESYQVTGGSMNYYDSFTDAVFRAEVAWFWDEPAFIVGVNDRPITGDVLPLPDPVLDLLAEATGTDPRSLGLNGLPWNPQSGEIPKKNVLRWVIGFDKQLWIRPLNKKSMFFLSMQYFGNWFPDYDPNLVRPVPEPYKFGVSSTGTVYPDYRVYPKIKEIESVFTGALRTNYMSGALIPQLAAVYDPRGAWMVQPSIQYIREPFRFLVQYSTLIGQFVSLGIMRDRDQIALSISYLLG
jgi:hypothetical protein